jgi:hypothetical protein
MTDAQKLELIRGAEKAFAQNPAIRNGFKNARDYALNQLKTAESTARKIATPVGQGAFGSTDESPASESRTAVHAFNGAVDRAMAMPNFRGDRRGAIQQVMRRDPQLHREYLEATNPTTTHRLISARFER